MNRFLALLCALLFASLTVSSACFADPVDNRLVRYDDLDLSTPAGLAALDQRIRRAADWVCLDPAAGGPGDVAQVNSACRERALSVGRTQVATLLASRGQQPSTLQGGSK